MDNPEIILNLWFVYDKMGIIYSLRARAYLGQGSDAQKMKLLESFALTDYLVARSFPVPARFHYHNMPVCLKPVYDALENRMEMYEDAIATLQAELPSQTPYDIPDRPLVCITPLLADDDGTITPHFTGEELLG